MTSQVSYIRGHMYFHRFDSLPLARTSSIALYNELIEGDTYSLLVLARKYTDDDPEFVKFIAETVVRAEMGCKRCPFYTLCMSLTIQGEGNSCFDRFSAFVKQTSLLNEVEGKCRKCGGQLLEPMDKNEIIPVYIYVNNGTMTIGETTYGSRAIEPPMYTRCSECGYPTETYFPHPLVEHCISD